MENIVVTSKKVALWFKAARVSDFPENGGACILYKNEQIAIFNFTERNEWYATQNLCPHKQEMCLSRGLIGDTDGEPKVACPFHKRSFSLKNGQGISDSLYSIKTYPVRISDGFVYIGLEKEEV
jgi:nitrite reductase (NADH) small subunit